MWRARENGYERFHGSEVLSWVRTQNSYLGSHRTEPLELIDAAMGYDIMSCFIA